MSGAAAGRLRPDLAIIAGMIAPGSRVLDVGCGDGALLAFLVREKGVDGRGMELSQKGVNACVAHGLSVVQGDADADLAHYPDGAFDYAVLSQTLQATRSPRDVVAHLVRIGRRAVVSFANFGHWRNRLGLLLEGRAPVLGGDGRSWHDTPNIHICTIRDFADMCAEMGLGMERVLSLSRSGRARPLASVGAGANLRGEEAIFLLSRR